MSHELAMLHINQNRSLEQLLTIASRDELSEIVNIITDNGKGRLSLDKDIRLKLEQAQKAEKLNQLAGLIAYEIRAFGSNTIANSMRKEPVSYIEVLCDVAKKLGVKKLNAKAPEVVIEQEVLIALLGKALDGKSAEERSVLLAKGSGELDSKTRELIAKATNKEALLQILKTSFNTYGISKLVATALSGSLVTAGQVFAVSTVVARVPALINPLGLALSAAWATYDMSGPAYRVTIPAIAHISFIRQTQIKFEVERAQMELKQCL